MLICMKYFVFMSLFRIQNTAVHPKYEKKQNQKRYVDFIVYICLFLSLSRLYSNISCQGTSTIFVTDNNWKIYGFKKILTIFLKNLVSDF